MPLKWTSEEAATGAALLNDVTLGRGAAYAEQGRVINMVLDPSGSMLTAVVLGSKNQRYSTIAKLVYDEGDFWRLSVGICSCPVARNCKHVAALMFSAENEPKVESALSRAAARIRREWGLPTAVEADAKDVVAPRPPGRLMREAGGWLVDPEGDPFAESTGSSWEDHLGALIGSSPANTGSQGSQKLQLALGFRPVPAQLGERTSLNGRSAAQTQQQVEVRPLAKRGNGKWRADLFGWSTVNSAARSFGAARGAEDTDANQLEWFLDFAEGARADSSVFSSYSKNWLNLASYRSRDLVEKLRLAAEAGVELIGQEGIESVAVAAKPATVSLDMARAESGVRVVPKITGPQGETWPLGQVTLLGAHTHSLMRARRSSIEESGGGRAKEQLTVLFAALEKPLKQQMQQFISGGPVLIPEQDEGRFITQFLPRLRNVAPVGSSDASVELPEVSEPELSLLISYLPGHVLRLHWEWHYRAGKQVTAHPLSSDPLEEPYRNPTMERQILDSVIPALRPQPALLEPDLGSLRQRPVAIKQLEQFDAVTFVDEVLPALRDIPRLDLEEEGVPPDFREIEEAPVVSIATEETPEQDWFDLRIIVTVQGEKVPFGDIFSELSKGRTKMMLPSGAYFSLEAEDLHRLRALIDEARTIEDNKDGSLRISKYHVTLWDELAALGIVSSQADAWKTAVESMRTLGNLEPQPVPEGVTATLRPYQQQGYNWLRFLAEHRLGGILADDMGLGKTLQTLAMIAAYQQDPLLTHDAGPHLVVAPTSVVGNWVSEARKFTPGLKVVSVSETFTRSKRPLAELLDADVIVTSYAIFRLDFEQFEPVRWATVVLDEAQFVKNRNSKAYQCARKVRANSKFAITGTPLENNLMDLWSLLSIAAPGLYPNPTAFGESIRKPIEKYGDTNALQRLRRRVSPLILRRTKELVATELPKKLEQVLEVELNPKHAKIYQTRLQRERQKILGLLKDMRKNQFSIFQSLTTLRLLSLDVSLADPEITNISSSKLDLLFEQLEDVIAEGHRALIFSQFTSFLALARARLDAANVPYSYLDGGTRNRQKVVDGFKNGTDPLFLISLKAGGFGINLTEADYCFILDPWWNPATEAQAVDRTHRIGQTKPVMVYRLVSKGTIEEKVMALKAKKSQLFSDVMESGQASSGVLTEADLRSLLE